MKKIFIFLLLCIYSFLSLTLYAQTQPPSVEHLPDQLKKLVPWVLKNHPEWSCPQVGADYQCLWVNDIQINVMDKKADFTISLFNANGNDQKELLPLPFYEKLPPSQLQIKSIKTQINKALPLVQKEGKFFVAIPPGEHEIKGILAWTEEPEYIHIPKHIYSKIELLRAGKTVPWYKYEEDRLWLQKEDLKAEQAQGINQQDMVSIQIFRRLTDGIPLKIQTLIKLNVSGKTRELIIPNVVTVSKPELQKLLFISGTLPTEVQKNDLKLFLKPGKHDISFDIAIFDPITELTVPHTNIEMNQPEIWSWFPNTTLRTVMVSGLTSVSADQVQLPGNDWKGSEIFLAQPNEIFKLDEKQRGIKELLADEINLDRTIWLDLDGKGLSIKDRITGTLNQSSRLNYQEKGVIGRVTNRNSGADNMLISIDPVDQQEGVELRSKEINLEVELRAENGSTQMSAVGWSKDINRLGIELNLPPGWLFLDAQGASSSNGAWLNQWDLINLFFVVLIVFLSNKLLSKRWAIATAVVFIGYHCLSDLPMWIWLQLLITIPLLLNIKNIFWYKTIWLYRWFLMLLFVAYAVEIAQKELKVALYPQLEHSSHFSPADAVMPTAVFEEKEADFEALQQNQNADIVYQKRAPAKSAFSLSYDEGNIGRKQDKKAYQAKEYYQDPQMMIQTGLGLPDWQWKSYQISFSSSVSHEQELKLWVLPPWIFRPLRALISILLLCLCWGIFMKKIALSFQPIAEGDKQGNLPLNVLPKLLVLCLLLLSLHLPQVLLAQEFQSNVLSQVDTPFLESEALEDVEKELKPKACMGECIILSDALVSIDQQSVLLTGILNAEAYTRFTLMGPITEMRWQQVSLYEINPSYEKSTQRVKSYLSIDQQQYQTLTVPAGVYYLEAQGTLAPNHQINLQMPNPPTKLTIESKSWESQGVDNGILKGTLTLTKLAQESSQAEDPSKVALQALASQLQKQETWYTIHRHIDIGFKWQVKTIIKRSNTSFPQSFALLLLPGEQLLDASLKANQGQVLLQFAAQQQEIPVNSEINPVSALSLAVQKQNSWSEVWYIKCTEQWQCDITTKLNPTSVNDFQYEYHPWPGESLELKFHKLQGVKGPISTIEKADYEYTPGESIDKNKLDLSIKASSGVTRKLELPAEIFNVVVEINTVKKFINLEGNSLNLPLQPGSNQVAIKWENKAKRMIKDELPQIRFDGEIVNLNLYLSIGSRFILWIYGPSWGAAILFWGELFILLLLSLAIGRYQPLPIKSRDIFLLSIGLMQISSFLWLTIIAWFFVFHIREVFLSKANLSRILSNFIQLGLLGFTLACLIILYGAIHYNLISELHMQVFGGNSSSYRLHWYVDRIAGMTPNAGVYSLPVWAWRILMLFWSFWLVSQLMNWASWGLKAFTSGYTWKSAVSASEPTAQSNVTGADAVTESSSTELTTEIAVIEKTKDE